MIPAEVIAQIRDRGPAGPIRARLCEIGNSNQLNDEEIAFVLQAARDPAPLVRSPAGNPKVGPLGPVESLVTRRTALATISSCLVDECVDAETRQEFTDTIVAALRDENPRLRHSAIACATESRLLQRPEVRQMVADLTNDTDPKVANLALRALGE
jgi:hypothetical protein